MSALVREASEFALKEFIKNPIVENEIVKLRHFESAFLKIKPSVSLKVKITHQNQIFLKFLQNFYFSKRIVKDMKK